MKLKMTGVTLVWILGSALIQSPLFAQQKSYKISGTVKDSSSKALNLVTVSLFRQHQPEQPLQSTYTDGNGKFTFTVADTGRYTLITTHTGFGEKTHDFVVELSDLILPVIELLPQAASLQGVTVVSRKPLVEQTDDKIIFNVENDPATKTETALDILRKTPFVTVDGEGNVQVNGQTNFRVLLNGRETSMFAQNVKEALRAFPGALITKIEVITTPSAKYDAEGVGGIINIITRKKVVGYNGSFNTYYSTMNWYNVNGNFSAKAGRFGFTMFYGAGGTPGQDGKAFSETIPHTTSLFTRRLLSGDRTLRNFWNNGNAELSYELDSLNTISAYGNISGGSSRSTFDQSIRTDFAMDPSITSYYDLDSESEYPTTSAGADFIRKFSNNKEREFSIRLNSEFGNSNSFLSSIQDNPSSDRYIINNSIAKNRQYTIQSDYVHPLKNNQKLEAGVKAILRRAKSDFESLIKYSESEDYKKNLENTDHFTYHQDVLSVYASYAFKIKKTSFRVGARLEHTVVNGDFVSADAKVKQNYTNILPNVQATTKLSNAVTLVMAYTQRIQRPYIFNLNPFVNNNDSLNISFGNPGLDPQTLHTVSAQTRISRGTTFLGLTLDASHSNDKIVQYASFDPTTGVTSTTSLNIGREFQMGVTGNISVKVNADWNVFVNGNLRYNRVSNNMNTGEVNSGLSGNANLNTSYKINKRFTATGYAGFFRAPVTIQASYPLNLWYGTGVGYKFFNEKLTVALMASNFFEKDREYRTVTKDRQFTTTTVSTFPFRGLAMSVNWSFGKLKENVSKKKGVTNDDLLGGAN